MSDWQMVKFGFLFMCGAYCTIIIAAAGLFLGFLIGKALL